MFSLININVCAVFSSSTIMLMHHTRIAQGGFNATVQCLIFLSCVKKVKIVYGLQTHDNLNIMEILKKYSRQCVACQRSVLHDM